LTYKQSQVSKDYEDELLRSWDNADIQINHIIERERKVNMKSIPQFHTRANHEYHMSKWKRCVYCENGIPIKEDEV
jgi:hypothetical protein